MQKDMAHKKEVGRRRFLKDSLVMGAGALAAIPLLETYALSSPNAAVPDSALKASISIDAGAVRHVINPNIYGTFIEHIGRCIYGGIYDEGSALSDEQGFRKDVLKAAASPSSRPFVPGPQNWGRARGWLC